MINSYRKKMLKMVLLVAMTIGPYLYVNYLSPGGSALNAFTMSKSGRFIDYEQKHETGSSPNSTTPPKLEVNYNVRYRQAQPYNYSRLFSYDDEGKCQGVPCKWPKMPGATKELVKWAPEIFEKVPQHFLDNFKNPCWVRDGAELNCLPYFYVIGMYKCGTTDIWTKIVDHPDCVDVPKEPHWWGPRRLGFTGTPCHVQEVLNLRNITGGVDDSSLEFYLNLYKSTGVPILINNTATRQGITYHPKVFGDASISTAYAIGRDWTKTYPNASEPMFTNADLIRAVQPNAKIILMVRDPTERANSWYWFSHPRHPKNNRTFHNFVDKTIRCLQDCVKKHHIRYCAYASDCDNSARKKRTESFIKLEKTLIEESVYFRLKRRKFWTISTGLTTRKWRF